MAKDTKEPEAPPAIDAAYHDLIRAAAAWEVAIGDKTELQTAADAAAKKSAQAISDADGQVAATRTALSAAVEKFRGLVNPWLAQIAGDPVNTQVPAPPAEFPG